MGGHQIDWSAVLGQQLCGLKPDSIETLEHATLAHAPRSIRLHPDFQTTDLPFNTQPIPWFRGGHWLCDRDVRPGAFLQHAAGDYYAQDAGSMLALALADVQPGQWVCDVCASPGGKSTAVLELLGSRGILVANEVISSRLALLKLALARSGYANSLTTNLDVGELAKLCGARFDCVLVDAPCTGQSMVHRGKQTMSAFSQVQIEHSAARQHRIMEAAGCLVRPEGRLVYSTCTFSVAENEWVVERFLDKHPGWNLLCFPELARYESKVLPGSYRLWPHRDACAGAFAAVLVNESDNTHASESRGISGKSAAKAKRRGRTEWLDHQRFPQDLRWLESQWTSRGYMRRDELHAFPACVDESWIQHCVAGLAVAKSKKSRWDLLYGSAKVRGVSCESMPFVELGDQQACRFVEGQSISVSQSLSGWYVARWKGRSLAWGKASHGLLKNHFPKVLRQTASL